MATLAPSVFLFGDFINEPIESAYSLEHHVHKWTSLCFRQRPASLFLFDGLAA
jgi:sorbitol-specific phosphotransferase system component IIC